MTGLEATPSLPPDESVSASTRRGARPETFANGPTGFGPDLGWWNPTLDHDEHVDAELAAAVAHWDDVEFKNGSCLELYSGCGDGGNLAFHTLGEARYASDYGYDYYEDKDWIEYYGYHPGQGTDSCPGCFQHLLTTQQSTIDDVNLTYAVWTLAAAPEPSTALLMGLGLSCLARK